MEPGSSALAVIPSSAQVEGRGAMCAGTDDHDAGGARVAQRGVQRGGQGEVPEEVGGELHLPAASGDGSGGQGHDPGIGDEDVERANPHVRAQESTDAGSDRSSAAARTGPAPGTAESSRMSGSAAAGRRVAMVTSAPAVARARTVSVPMPEAPPVTRARRPVSSTPLDGGRSRARRRGLPVDPRRALQGHGRSGTARIPDAMAHRARVPAAAGRHRDDGRHRRSVGYGSESALSVAFKRVMGVSPRDYRRRDD